jgi:hypothetical protein
MKNALNYLRLVSYGAVIVKTALVLIMELDKLSRSGKYKQNYRMKFQTMNIKIPIEESC